MRSRQLRARLLRVVNAALMPLDRLLEAGGESQPEPLFIVGVPRSGTTLTYQVLTQNLQCAYFTRLMGYGYGAANLLHRLYGHRIGRPAENYTSTHGRIAGDLAPSEHAAFWLHWLPAHPETGHRHVPAATDPAALAPMARQAQALARLLRRPLVIKCVYLSLSTAVLAEAFPTARFLHVTREPVPNCLSIVTARQRLGYQTRWWSVQPPGFSALLDRPLAFQAAVQWREVNRLLREDLQRYAPGRHREIAYEALCANPRTVLDALAQWLAPAGFRPYPALRLPGEFLPSGASVPEPAVAAEIRRVALDADG